MSSRNLFARCVTLWLRLGKINLLIANLVKLSMVLPELQLDRPLWHIYKVILRSVSAFFVYFHVLTAVFAATSVHTDKQSTVESVHIVLKCFFLLIKIRMKKLDLIACGNKSPKPLADPREGARDGHPLSVQFLSFSCSFRQKLGFRPELGGWRPPQEILDLPM